MYHYLGIWIRLIWTSALGLLFVIVLFLLEKKMGVIAKILLSVIVLALLIWLMLPTIKALNQPQLVTIEGAFHNAVAGYGISPFELRYWFECDGELVYVDMDPFSKRRIFPDNFSKGETYKIVYEKTTNLIVFASKTS